MDNVHRVKDEPTIKQEIVDLEFCSSELFSNSNVFGSITKQEFGNLKEEADCTIKNILISDSGGLTKYEVLPVNTEHTEITSPDSNANHEKDQQDSHSQEQPSSTSSLTGPKLASNQDLVCKICSFEADTKKGFESHHRAMHDSERVRCPKCGSMVTKSGLDLHLTMHSANGLRSCSKCDFKGSRRQLWKHRVQDHIALKSYRKYNQRYYCTVCQLRFFRKKELESHVKRHYIKTNYGCKKCHSFFDNVWSLEFHSARRSCKESGENSLICQHCKRTFRTRLYHDVHLRTKHKSLLSYEELAKPILGLTCPVESCRRIFYNSNDLSNHKKRCHKPWRPCTYCQQVFPSEKLRRHVRLKHPNILAQEKGQRQKLSIFGCNKCSASFKKEIEYDLHALSHSFSSAASVATNEHVHVCSYCFKRFSCNRSRIQHEQKMVCRRAQIKKETVIETEIDSPDFEITEKPFSDPEMNSMDPIHSGKLDSDQRDKKISSNKATKLRMNVDSSKCVNYSCDSCSTRFSSNSALQRHRKRNVCGKNTLHGSCPGCREEFDNTNVLKKHMRYCVHL